jgi:superfamily II DNA or RNA helicase
LPPLSCADFDDDRRHPLNIDPNLPIFEALPALQAALAARSRVVLEAPPGAGKTTVVPLALLDAPWLAGQKILMLEPRRIAARSAATYMARQLGEEAGRACRLPDPLRGASGQAHRGADRGHPDASDPGRPDARWRRLSDLR